MEAHTSEEIVPYAVNIGGNHFASYFAAVVLTCILNDCFGGNVGFSLVDNVKRWLARQEETGPERNAMVMSGGGARAAYQVGVIKYISEDFPDALFSVFTGVSAGAINTAGLVNFEGSFPDAASRLVSSWRELSTDRVVRPESTISMFRRLWFSGKKDEGEYDTTSNRRRALLDASPLREYMMQKLGIPESGVLTAVQKNIDAGRLHACAVITTNYNTGQSVSWVQGADVSAWQRPNRKAIQTEINIDHIMASAALPLLFPAVRIGDSWYGDGGVRLTMPLSTAMNLGADRLLVISTRYDRSRAEADEKAVQGYPPASQILGVLMNAIFLDVLDQDAMITQQINELIKELPKHKRLGMRPIRLLTLRPSQDIGKLAGSFEMELSGALGWATSGQRSSENKSPDWLSMLMFEHDYVNRLMEIGYSDARQQREHIEKFLAD